MGKGNEANAIDVSLIVQSHLLKVFYNYHN